MARTTSSAVLAILLRDYDSVNNPSLEPFIEAASSLMDDVAACAVAADATLSSTKLELMERWLAAHFYTKNNPVYQSKTTSQASATFVRGKKEPEPYKDAALMLDSTGCLASALAGNRAGGFWAGKVPSEQIPYDQRN
jgi:hypothetical protein